MPIDEYNTISIAADANKLLVPSRPTMEQYVQHMIETEGGEASDYEQNYSDYRTWLEGEGYYNISPISGIFKSFSDAPNGFKEELQEIQWSVGLEYAYNNQFFLRAGYHYEHPNKGNRTTSSPSTQATSSPLPKPTLSTRPSASHSPLTWTVSATCSAREEEDKQDSQESPDKPESQDKPYSPDKPDSQESPESPDKQEKPDTLPTSHINPYPS